MLRNYVGDDMQGEAAVKLVPQGEGHASAGVRIDLRDWFKGAIYEARFTRRALLPAEFLKLPAAALRSGPGECSLVPRNPRNPVAWAQSGRSRREWMAEASEYR